MCAVNLIEVTCERFAFPYRAGMMLKCFVGVSEDEARQKVITWRRLHVFCPDHEPLNLYEGCERISPEQVILYWVYEYTCEGCFTCQSVEAWQVV